MGLFLFFLLFFSVQAEVVSLPSNTTVRIQSTGFRIEGSALTGQNLVPLTNSLIQSTNGKLQVPYALIVVGRALLTSSGL